MTCPSKGTQLSFRVVLLSVLIVASRPVRSEDHPRLHVVTPKDQGIIATGINDRGDVIGFEWIEERPGILKQEPFLARGPKMVYLPLLPGYTSAFPEGVSDLGVVVGRVSKPAPFNVPVQMRNQGFVWDEANGMRGLGVLPDDVSSFACGISRDGSRISGFSVGKDRVRPCLWELMGEQWAARVLPHESKLGSTTVAISGNGQYVTAVDGTVPCLWTRQADGTWSREVIGESRSLLPRGVNNSATVVGSRVDSAGFPHAAIWKRVTGISQFQEPAGYVKSEAYALNNHGLVVGMVDGPAGSPIGPNAFVVEEGKLRIIHEGGPWFVSATAINDQGQVAGVFEKEDEVENRPEVP